MTSQKRLNIPPPPTFISPYHVDQERSFVKIIPIFWPVRNMNVFMSLCFIPTGHRAVTTWTTP